MRRRIGRRGGRRAHAIAAALFCAGAVVSWWMVVDEGPSTARMMAAVATSVAAVAEVVRMVRIARTEKRYRSGLPAERPSEPEAGAAAGREERDGS